jgi:hypothetical protein
MATNVAVAAPSTPQAGMRTAPPPMSRTVHTIEFASFTRVCPVMSIIDPQMPVPAFTSSAQARTINAADPAVKLLPNSRRMGSENSTMTRKNGTLRVNVHRVAVVYRRASPSRSCRAWSWANDGFTAMSADWSET